MGPETVLTGPGPAHPARAAAGALPVPLQGVWVLLVLANKDLGEVTEDDYVTKERNRSMEYSIASFVLVTPTARMSGTAFLCALSMEQETSILEGRVTASYKRSFRGVI